VRVMHILALLLPEHVHIFIVIHTTFCVLLLSRKLNVCFNKWNAVMVNIYIFHYLFIIGIFYYILLLEHWRVCVRTSVCTCACMCTLFCYVMFCFVSFCFLSGTNIMWTSSHLFSLEICLVSNGIQGIINANWLFICSVWCGY
jgi:hypothetical protein